MNGRSRNAFRLLLLFGSPLLCAPLMTASAAPLYQDQQPAPDNTKKNKDQTEPTADQQKMNAADRAITQKIRKAILADKDLSTYAHNIKVITQDGKVTLRGPVRSQEEKSSLQDKAAAVAGQDNVTNELEVKPANN